jgi:phage baseplate assembly protein W
MPSPRQSAIETPHFLLPMTHNTNGDVLVLEQDTVEEIVQCIEVLIGFPIGSNRNVPTFGTPDITFKSLSASAINSDQLKTAILQWEERAAMSIDDVPILTDDLIQQILIRVGTSDV